MDKRTICKILKGKHEDFLKSVKSGEIKKLIKENSIITGGAITSLLLNEKVNDFDIYFTNKEACEEVAKYFVQEFSIKHPGIQFRVESFTDRVKIIIPSGGIVGDAISGYIQPNEVDQAFVDKIVESEGRADDLGMEVSKDKEKYRPIFISSNAITLSSQVQLIIRFYGNVDQIHKNYDFVHCTNYWDSKTNKLVLNQPALESILAKRLYYVGSLYPVCSIIRTRKFIQRGWRINAGQYLKMAFQVSSLDLKDLSVLEDQLVGVDCAYFFQIIEWCKSKQEQDPKFEITTPYLASIVDKIFG